VVDIKFLAFRNEGTGVFPTHLPWLIPADGNTKCVTQPDVSSWPLAGARPDDSNRHPVPPTIGPWLQGRADTPKDAPTNVAEWESLKWIPRPIPAADLDRQNLQQITIASARFEHGKLVATQPRAREAQGAYFSLLESRYLQLSQRRPTRQQPTVKR